MCNGNSTRVTQGGSIAVLRPTPQSTLPPSSHEILLLFSNHTSSPGTRVASEGWNHDDRHWVVIHRDGDLSSPAQRQSSNPLYSFSLGEARIQLPERLDLGVSEVGIIGRRVSVMTTSTGGPLAVAEGIIGWN